MIEKMGAENLRRFECEVQLTSQLTHPNTISIYDYGRTPDGLFYYAMEYLDGFTLAELVEATGPLVAPPRGMADAASCRLHRRGASDWTDSQGHQAAGRHVFQAKTIVEVCTHHLRTAPEPLSKATGGPLPDGMEDLILTCLAKDPSHRPQNAETLERALSAMVDPSSWTQDDARVWWRDHEDDLARLRAGRSTLERSGEKPRIVRSTTLVA
jgi:serine/threonine protein kinase